MFIIFLICILMFFKPRASPQRVLFVVAFTAALIFDVVVSPMLAAIGLLLSFVLLGRKS